MTNLDRPGWQTTEFWGKVAIQVLGLLVAFNVIHVTDVQVQLIIGFITMAVAEAGYSASRGQVKAATIAAAVVAQPVTTVVEHVEANSAKSATPAITTTTTFKGENPASVPPKV